MKQIISLLAILLMSASAFSQASGGNDGHGGGGINSNGVYSTFYSAGFYREPLEQTIDQVPQLNNLVKIFSEKPLTVETKTAYMNALLPSDARKYYKVNQETFTPEVRARLIAEYGRVMKTNTQNLVLFAVTDTTSNSTYLFPEFYKLTPNQQMAILVHEAYWIIRPYESYENVIQVEMSFQAYLENPNSNERFLNWINKSSTSQSGSDDFVVAVTLDLNSGALKGLINKDGNVALSDLLGSNFINCKMAPSVSNSVETNDDCVSFLLPYAFNLLEKYPNSEFVKLYLKRVSMIKSMNGFYIGYSACTDGYGNRHINNAIKTHNVKIWSWLSKVKINLKNPSERSFEHISGYTMYCAASDMNLPINYTIFF